MIKESPCYNCEKRVANAEYNCHQDCTEYLDYRNQLSNLNKQQRDDVYSSYISKTIYRKKKIKNEKNRT